MHNKSNKIRMKEHFGYLQTHESLILFLAMASDGPTILKTIRYLAPRYTDDTLPTGALDADNAIV